MKKILLVLIMLISLVGCNKIENNENNDNNALQVPGSSALSIVSPSGAPALAFYNEIANDGFNTGDAKSILPELKGNGDTDVIVIDTVNGIKVLNDGANYKLAATITFGNFYIGATGNDDNGIMEDGDYIVVFSQGATPDLVFHYLYGNSLDSNLHFVSAVADASTCLIKGINIADEERSIDEDPYVDYVMIAEPALSAAKAQNENIYTYQDIQELYKEKTNGLSMIQASVFISNNVEYELAKEYLSSLENNINLLIDHPELFGEAVTQNGLDDTYVKDLFGVPNAKLAQKVLSNNSIGLGYQKAIDIKDDIDGFIQLFGVEKTSEEIYFK